jgi:lipoate-protein ligase A
MTFQGTGRRNVRHSPLLFKFASLVQLLTYSAESPEWNLAIDEALLLSAEEGRADESLRFWSSPTLFVVLGHSRSVTEDVDVQRCGRDGVPVLRRYSGGGTVLQGPGCLNYNLVLRRDREAAFTTITGTTREILRRHAAALSPFLSGTITREGDSDLAIDGKKFSGNAQRRLFAFVQFHGTLLLEFDLGTLERYLREPGRQPAYREGRRHRDFVANIPIEAGLVRDLFASAWSATGPPVGPPLAMASRLVNERYGREEWNWKR